MKILLSAILLVSVLTKTEFYEALATDNEQVLEKVYLQTQKASFTEEKGAYLSAQKR